MKDKYGIDYAMMTMHYVNKKLILQKASFYKLSFQHLE